MSLRGSFLPIAILFSAFLNGAVPDYFPLQVGVQWVYRAGGSRAGTPLVLEVTQSREFNGKTYFLLQGYPRADYWLRNDGSGNVFAYDPGTNEEKLWYAFQSPDGETYSESLPNCCGRATIVSRSAKYTGPIGDFDYALEIRYPGVFQVGIERELFLPYVGLVHRSEATGGPSYATYDLTYARLGVTVISEKELTFGLTIDKAVYVVENPRNAPVMTARLTLRSTQDQPIALAFPSSQSYDLVIKNERGDVVYRWSDGRGFNLIFRTESFGPGEKNYVVLASLASSDGKPLPPGKYVAEGWLTTQPPRVFSASVAFEIR
jgi:hypothetical protein